jgi:hypothetical protein
MRHFDGKLWRDRSWARLRRATGDGRPTRSSEKKWAVDAYAIDDIERVVGWCDSRGIEVLFGRRSGGVYDEAAKKIIISAHAPPRKQLVYLLHECGHHLVSAAGVEDDRFKMGYSSAVGAGDRTFVHKLAVLEEEFEAWHRGWRLAKRLELTLSREEFDTTRLECLKSYIRWTNRRSIE